MVTVKTGRPVAAIGNFDGVHRGHQYLLAETRKLADAAGVEAQVVVFNPHPRQFFRPDDAPFLLTAPEERARLLHAFGADKVLSLRFDGALAALDPQAFVRDILDTQLQLGAVVTGAEFHFGKGRAGDAAMLRALCHEHGMSAHQVSPLRHQAREEKIGSSAVRAALRAGDVTRAAHLLGRPWGVSGSVVQGQKLGRTIGFPTANLTLGELIEPQYGVYAVTATVMGDEYQGVANFGRRPTVGAAQPLLEVHLFDFSGDLYGETVTVRFAGFIRREEKFDGVEALKQQIARDVETARAFFRR